MLGLTFTKYHSSKNDKGEKVEVYEFEVDRFDGLNKYRLYIVEKLIGTLEKEDSENNTWKVISQPTNLCTLFALYNYIDSILPRNPTNMEKPSILMKEFEIARTFWLEGRKHAQEEIEREKAQEKEEKKKAREDRMF